MCTLRVSAHIPVCVCTLLSVWKCSQTHVCTHSIFVNVLTDLCECILHLCNWVDPWIRYTADGSWLASPQQWPRHLFSAMWKVSTDAHTLCPCAVWRAVSCAVWPATLTETHLSGAEGWWGLQHLRSKVMAHSIWKSTLLIIISVWKWSLYFVRCIWILNNELYYFQKKEIINF